MKRGNHRQAERLLNTRKVRLSGRIQAEGKGIEGTARGPRNGGHQDKTLARAEGTPRGPSGRDEPLQFGVAETDRRVQSRNR